MRTGDREMSALRILVDDATPVKEIVGKGDKQHRKGIEAVKIYLLGHEKSIGSHYILCHMVH